MSIELFVKPSEGIVSWDKFCNNYPKFSIALDGFVNEGPIFNEDKMMLNLNHHEGVDRLATRATCAQTLMSIRQGLFQSFRNNIGAVANVYANDCDEDVCTSWFLLHNHHLVVGTMNPMINKLVSIEDALDSTAGAYPYPADLPILQELAWVFEPYRQFRLSGGLENRNEASFKSIITDVESRILSHVTGHGKSIPLDIRYEVMYSGHNWSMVKENGAHARTGMFADGIKAYVSVRERKDGKYSYTLGRLSPFIKFPLIKFTNIFNEVDDSVSDNDRWGGGNNIMGSPRNAGSSIKPDQIILLINEMMM